jgi:hypothetical protein
VARVREVTDAERRTPRLVGLGLRQDVRSLRGVLNAWRASQAAKAALPDRRPK